MTTCALESPPDVAAPTRKAVLFCPTCGHESGVSGDWIVRCGDGGDVYECPECGTDIATRKTG